MKGEFRWQSYCRVSEWSCAKSHFSVEGIEFCPCGCNHSLALEYLNISIHFLYLKNKCITSQVSHSAYRDGFAMAPFSLCLVPAPGVQLGRLELLEVTTLKETVHHSWPLLGDGYSDEFAFTILSGSNLQSLPISDDNIPISRLILPPITSNQCPDHFGIFKIVDGLLTDLNWTCGPIFIRKEGNEKMSLHVQFISVNNLTYSKVTVKHPAQLFNL